MQTSVFHSFMSSILYELSTVQRHFEENETFLDTSVMALSLEVLAGEVENLRKFLVSGYDKEK